jgi:hypothetical protein
MTGCVAQWRAVTWRVAARPAAAGHGALDLDRGWMKIYSTRSEKNHAAISCTMHDLWNCEIDRDRFLGDHRSEVRMLAHTLIAALRTDAQHVSRAPITKFRYAIFNRTLVSAMASTPRAMIRRDAHPDGFCEKSFSRTRAMRTRWGGVNLSENAK